MRPPLRWYALCLILLPPSPADGQDGGTDTRPALQGLAARAVNSPKGVACPALFDGGAGLCFPATTIPRVTRALADAPLLGPTLNRALAAETVAEAAKKAAASWQSASEAQDRQIARLGDTVRALESATKNLSDALAKARSGSIWPTIAAVVGIAAVLFGIGYAAQALR